VVVGIDEGRTDTDKVLWGKTEIIDVQANKSTTMNIFNCGRAIVTYLDQFAQVDTGRCILALCRTRTKLYRNQVSTRCSW
jgi:hypothetical protein